jgi:hypothetical protein
LLVNKDSLTGAPGGGSCSGNPIYCNAACLARIELPRLHQERSVMTAARADGKLPAMKGLSVPDKP